MIVLKREVVVERALEFVVKFSTSKATLPKPNAGEGTSGDISDEEEDCDLHPLLYRLFEFLLNVRFPLHLPTTGSMFGASCNFNSLSL